MGSCCSCNRENREAELNNIQTFGEENRKKKNEDQITYNYEINNEAQNLRFSSLVKNDDNLKSISENFEKILKACNLSNNEKLRMALLILKTKTEADDHSFENEQSIQEFKTSFTGPVEKYYKAIIEVYNNSGEGYKPLIKLIQIFELMLENNFKKNERDSLIDRFKSVIDGYKNTDWRYLRKLCDQAESLKIEEVSLEMNLVQGFLKEMNKNKKALIWKTDKNCELAEKVIDCLFELEQKNQSLFAKCLVKGRFEKYTELNLGFSLVLGDEGGLYLLLNSVEPGSEQEKIILEAGVSKEFLKEKTSCNTLKPKVILGEGSFGKVRLAFSIFGSMRVDIGQLVCVKKSLRIGEEKNKALKTNTLANVTDSCFEDFFLKSLNDSIYVPRPLDMSIITNKKVNKNHRKAYLMMEIVPQNMADKTFENSKYHKWEYQKPYILENMKTMNSLLLEQRVFNSDLKPQNTLFDPLSRKTAIIDLGSSLFIEKHLDIENYDISEGGFGKTDLYCPPEILEIVNSDTEGISTNLNLRKSISYLCGVTLAEITSVVPNNLKGKQNIDNWVLAEKTDLAPNLRNQLESIIKGLIEKDPKKRITMENAINNIQLLGSDIYVDKAIQEIYVQNAKELSRSDPSLLNLNIDINETKKKGIIKLYLVKNIPEIINQEIMGLNEEFDNYFKSKNEKIFLLLGEAGSGKSLSLQLQFLKELDNWEYGLPVPIFFNMADEIDLDRAFRRINAKLGSNINVDTKSEEIHLFIDSYDEGAGQFFIRNRSQSEKPEDPSVEKIEKASLVQEYLKKLSNWRVVKILISCRTEFVHRQGIIDLTDFNVGDTDAAESLRIRYIVPIGYSEKTKKQEEFIRDWLDREGVMMEEAKITEIFKLIKRLGLKKRMMRTGLVFNMIMKIVLSIKEGISTHKKLSAFEIYMKSIQVELLSNWKTFISNKESKEEFKIKILRNELATLISNKEEDPMLDQKELIINGMIRMGEKMAAYMLANCRNRLNFSQLEVLVKNSLEIEAEQGLRLKWKTLYHICKIMGFKLENKAKNEGNGEEYGKEDLDIGFRHETYKNFFILSGFKRIFSKEMQKGEEIERDEEIILDSVLNNEQTLENYELLRFFGEEIKFKDQELKMGLRKILNLEQEKLRQTKIKNQNNLPEKNLNTILSKEKNNFLNKNRRPAVTTSLLVAGSYSFNGEDLSDLNLGKAYLRGGQFIGTAFERTILTEANLSNANVSFARFLATDLREIELGIPQDLRGHLDPISTVCFSPDGMSLASASHDNTVKIWDHAYSKCINTLKGHINYIKSICFGPDGKSIASGSLDLTVKIWELATGECIFTLKGHEKAVRSVCFSIDGKRLASGSDDKTVKIWNSVNGVCVLTLTGHENLVSSVCFSPEGNILASGSFDKSIKIWDTTNGKCTQTLKEIINGNITCVCFSPDGKKLASGSWVNKIKLWDSENWQCVQTLIGHSDWINSVCFSPDGKRVASGSDDYTVKIWDPNNGECKLTLKGHRYYVNSVSFSPDGKKIASGSSDKLGKIWGFTNGECVQKLKGHKYSINKVCFNPEGNLLASGSIDKSVKIWDTNSGELVQTLKGHSDSVKCISFSPNGKQIASGSVDNTVKIWELDNGNCVQTLKEHSRYIIDVCFSPDGKWILSGSGDYKAKIWDSLGGTCLQTLSGHKGKVRKVCFSPDGKKVATGSDDKIVNIWESDSGKTILSLTKMGGSVSFICFSPDGQRIASCSTNLVYIWELSNGRCIYTLREHEDIVIYIWFNLQDNGISSWSEDNTIKVWSTTEKCLATYRGKGKTVTSVAFSQERNIMAEASETEIILCRKYLGKEYVLSLDQGTENTFKCKNCLLKDCVIDKKSKRDVMLFELIQQDA